MINERNPDTRAPQKTARAIISGSDIEAEGFLFLKCLTEIFAVTNPAARKIPILISLKIRGFISYNLFTRKSISFFVQQLGFSLRVLLISFLTSRTLMQKRSVSEQIIRSIYSHTSRIFLRSSNIFFNSALLFH